MTTAEIRCARSLEREKQLGADQSSYYLNFGARVRAMVAELAGPFTDQAREKAYRWIWRGSESLHADERCGNRCRVARLFGGP